MYNNYELRVTVRLRALPVADEANKKNCRTVKICRRSKPITNSGNRWSRLRISGDSPVRGNVELARQKGRAPAPRAAHGYYNRSEATRNSTLHTPNSKRKKYRSYDLHFLIYIFFFLLLQTFSYVQRKVFRNALFF